MKQGDRGNSLFRMGIHVESLHLLPYPPTASKTAYDPAILAALLRYRRVAPHGKTG
jgi:hypothetical protein